MKLKTQLHLLLVIGIALFLSSCGGNGVNLAGGVSNKTGWPYNDKDWGDFQVVEPTDQDPGPDLVLIQGGVFTMGNVEQDIAYDWNSMRRRVTLSSYYIDQHEVSNVNYREYLHWLGKVFDTKPEILENAKPDTLVWRRRLAYNEPFVQTYFRDPHFNNYPVVGVTWVQANDYCLWRTDRVNEKLLVDAGVINFTPVQPSQDVFTTDAYLAGLYQGASPTGKLKDASGQARNATIEDGIILPNYRLPTEAEWEYAALGLIGNSEAERIAEYRYYPWDGHQLRNDLRPNVGRFYANFVRGKGDYMGVAGYLNDAAAPTAPVDAFWPNDYGLYNMAGNVNEWVLDVYRPLSNMDVDDFNPFRGNVFQVVVKNKDGSFPSDALDSLGHLRRRNVGEKDPYSSGWTDDDLNKEVDRYNYKTADNRNYKDGDLRSTLGPQWLDVPDQGSQQMYNYNGTGKGHNGATSLINDESRVYKGGGWRDRAYWLIPGTRRFLDQNRATDDIGFRCAMIKTGAPK